MTELNAFYESLKELESSINTLILNQKNLNKTNQINNKNHINLKSYVNTIQFLLKRVLTNINSFLQEKLDLWNMIVVSLIIKGL